MNANKPMTFFVWADTHFGYRPGDGDADLRWRILRQMIRLPGRPFPPEIGGQVDSPGFIMHCGDFLDGGGDGAQALGCYLRCRQQTDLPFFETLGNHETGYANAVEYIVRKYGGRYYSFERQGTRFISLYQVFDEREKVKALDSEQLQWLKRNMAAIGCRKPVVLFAHDRLDNLPNADEVDSILGKANVLLLLSGHHHLYQKYTWHGRTGVSTGHCRDHPSDSINGRTITVVRITESQVAAVPWRWDLQEWGGEHNGVDSPVIIHL